MTRLGHPFNENMSIFPDDPFVDVDTIYSVDPDFFKVEQVRTGAHAGTHLDVRGMTFKDNLIQKKDIQSYERRNGQIRPGSLVILQTGAEKFFGLDGAGDVYGLTGATREDKDGNDVPILDEEGNQFIVSDNTDDLFDFVNPGFSGKAVQWLFDKRDIDGVGSDAYGPDAATDEDFDATFTTLDNDGVALVAIANHDSVSVRGDVIMAPTVSLTDGSGFSTDPIACHGVSDDDDVDDDREDEDDD